jgi:hypothetical protein
MTELFNWHNTSIVLQYNWYWLLLAFILGAWIGYKTCMPEVVRTPL